MPCVLLDDSGSGAFNLQVFMERPKETTSATGSPLVSSTSVSSLTISVQTERHQPNTEEKGTQTSNIILPAKLVESNRTFPIPWGIRTTRVSVGTQTEGKDLYGSLQHGRLPLRPVDFFTPTPIGYCRARSRYRNTRTVSVATRLSIPLSRDRRRSKSCRRSKEWTRRAHKLVSPPKMVEKSTQTEPEPPLFHMVLKTIGIPTSFLSIKRRTESR